MTNITSATHAADILDQNAGHCADRMKYLRTEIGKCAGTSSTTDLAAAVAEIARHEAAFSVYHVAAMVTRNDGATAARRVTADRLIQGPDDIWSGRTNDLQRERFDAVRAAARTVMGTLDFVTEEA